MVLTLSFRSKVLLLIFAASGFAGLIYQSIWTHYLGLLLGHSSYAQVLVLALFMGGMALGAWLASRRSNALARPLRTYAYIEFALGVFGVAFHPYYLQVSAWAYDVLFPIMAPGLSLEAARWVIAGMLILPQCILLGATFPLMSAGFIRWRPDSSGNILAGLYFSNSIGAALGALGSTFLLLPVIGLPGAVLTAGIINVFVAIAIWPLAKHDQPQPQPLATTERTEPSGSVPFFILLAAGITGASSFMYEISWVRMLSMVLGSTIHAFELMLAAFIAGIAFGGLWLRKRADKLVSPRRAAGFAQIAMGCMALGTLFLYNHSFSWIAWAMQTLNRSAESAYSVYNFASAAISIIIMFPTAFFAGMTLPLLTLTLLKDGHGEASIGRAYAANTLGAILGVLLAIGIALPLLGLRMTIWLAAGADIVLGVFLLINLGLSGSARRFHLSWKAAASVGIGFAMLFLALRFTHFDPLLMSSTVFRSGVVNALARDKTQVLFQEDGRTATVSLLEIDGKHRTILTNGKPDASIGIDGKATSDEITMMLAAILPMLHNSDARNVAIIGFGSGMTTHFMLGNPAIESVDTIEIEPAMVEAAQQFRPVIERAYSDPRSHILIDDAKSFISTNRKKYDIIVSEPSNPWVNGVAALFTDEFYAFVPKHLNEGGVFAQWIQAYELSPALMSSIVNAMLPHFADIKLYAAGPVDWLLVASPERKLPREAGMAIPETWSPAMRDEMRERGIGSASDIAMLYTGNRKTLLGYSLMYPGSGVNSDFFPILQLGSAKARFNNAWASELAKLRLADWPVFEVMTGFEPDAANVPLPDFLLQRIDLTRTTQRARLIYAMLLGMVDSHSGPGSAIPERFEIESLRTAARTCRIDTLGTDALLLLTRLAAKTTPYLEPDAAELLWKKAEWIKCPPRNPLLRNYLEFIGALASRNYDAALVLGQSIIADPAKLAQVRRDKVVLSHLVGGMQVAAVAADHRATALELENQFGADLEPSFARGFLLHMVRKGL